MDNLEFFRDEIEKIDKELAILISKRMDISKNIGEYKKEHGISVFDPEREEMLKNKNACYIKKEFQPGYGEIFDVILKVSKDLQL